MSEFTAGQRVRVTIEGPLTYNAVPNPYAGYTQLEIGDSTIYLDDKDYPEVRTTVEVIQPPVLPGQVWLADGRTWFVRETSTGATLVVASPGRAGEKFTGPSEWIATHPAASLAYDPHASEEALDALRVKLAHA